MVPVLNSIGTDVACVGVSLVYGVDSVCGWSADFFMGVES